MLLFGVVILLCGMAIGGGLTTKILWNRLLYNIQHPEHVPVLIVKSMEKGLGLNAEQADQIRPIINAHFKNIHDIRREIRPRFDAELDGMRNEVAAVLTPEQAEHWKKGFDALRAKLQLPVAVAGLDKP